MTTLAPGARLGPYEIAAPIGAGGMGEVYRARDTRLDRHVAIKVLPERTARDPQAVARFEREARAIAALSHPNILAIHDIGRDGDTVFVVMELLEGKTLRDAMPLPLKKAVDIAAQVAQGLAAAHAKGVIHRDLKPENIFLTNDGGVKILDFGLAKFTEPSGAANDPNATRGVANTDAGLVLGTTGYLSPEQAQGQAVDARSDIFAFGAVLYEMVTGGRAFAGKTTIDTLHKIVHDTPAPVASRAANAPGELQWVIAKCLAKDPDERYQSTRDLVVDLKKVVRAVETSTSAISLPPAARRPRSSRLAAVVAAAVAAFLAAGGFAWWRSGPHDAESVARAVTVERVTTLGTVIDANVSPDGKYVAYATSENAKQGIFLRQLATASTIAIVPPGPVGDWGMAFSPDGNELFYSMYTPEEPLRAIFRIPVLGGTPRKLITGTDSRPIPSPDGRRLAWVRGAYPQPTDSALIVADADGSHLRVVATVHAPDVFVPIFFTQPAWSPDGKALVAPMQHRGDATFGTFAAFDAQSGAPIMFPAHRFASVGPAVWTPDGAGLIVIATAMAERQRPPQVWWISARDTTERRITNDLLDYRLVSLTADGKTLVVVGSDSTSSVWTVPLDGSSAAVRVGAGRYDGLNGIAAASQGHIVYRKVDNGAASIWQMDERGGNPKLVTTAGEPSFPAMMPDGKSIVVARQGAEGLWQVPLEGGDAHQVEGSTPAIAPAVTPDGKWIFYEATITADDQLWKIPAAGGLPERAVEGMGRAPAISPDGRQIAFYYRAARDRPIVLAVMPIDGRQPAQTFPVLPSTYWATVRWTRDGKALLHNSAIGDRTNVWLQPLAGGEPQRITSFADQSILGFDVSADGKSLVIARGQLSRDAVMIRGF